MINLDENNLKNEIIKIARLSAERFTYYKSENPNANNYYIGENEVEGQCSDYALFFVINWNKKYPDNPAEIVAVNQKYINSGSHELVKEVKNNIDFDLPQWWNLEKSQWFANQNIDGVECSILFHPNLGFYKLIQKDIYEVKKHFGYDMAEKGSHVWAKVGNIAVDPCWADTDNTPFIGEDIILND
jgi:hypothetical protein